MKSICIEISGSDVLFRVDRVGHFFEEQSKEGPDYLIAHKQGDLWNVDMCSDTPDDIVLYGSRKEAILGMMNRILNSLDLETD